MFKSIIILGLLNTTNSVPLFFFCKKHKNVPLTNTLKNTSKNKTDYKNIPVVRYNSSLLITMIMHDLCFIQTNRLHYVYKKDKLV